MWRGSIYLQLKGMPIGPRGTSGVSRVVMNYFDRELIRSLSILRIEYDLLMRYIDDIRSVLRRIRCGTVIRNNCLEIDEDQKALDEKLEDP